ncbi:hypothetical protein TNCV_1769401 [Trichonephila clavipes]|nr:hypothetical protein TNCV_1769401 [Trichonephila clavipes]
MNFVIRHPTGIVYGGTLNSRRAASPVVWLVEGGREVGGPCPPPGFSPSKLGGTEQNRTVTSMLKAKANDRRKNSSP